MSHSSLIKKIRSGLGLFRSRMNGPVVFKQELLLKKALLEAGIAENDVAIECDHDLGLNFVNGIQVGIKYPMSFALRAKEMSSREKIVDFYFNGFINDSGGRRELLDQFQRYPNVNIIASDEGRDVTKKDVFNEDYFTQFSEAKFGLCPHQLNWRGSKEHMWTYRFIESCFVGAIPVLFEATPLGHDFIDGFKYIWDYEVRENHALAMLKYSLEHSVENQTRAMQIFCLHPAEIEAISNTV